MANQVGQAIAVHVFRIAEGQTRLVATVTEGKRSLVYQCDRIECATRQDGHRDFSFAAWVDAVGRIAWLDVDGDPDERKAGAGQADHLRAARRVVGDRESPRPRPSGRRYEDYTNGAVRTSRYITAARVGLSEVPARNDAGNFQWWAARVYSATVCAALVVPTSCLAKETIVGNKAMKGRFKNTETVPVWLAATMSVEPSRSTSAV